MDWLFDAITGWMKGMMIDGIMSNMTSMFELINDEVQTTAVRVGMTPADFSPRVFAMIRGISETVILPIAGIILTFVCCWELIQMIMEHNNMANFEISLIFKWIMKTFVAVVIVSNTFNITMAVFDVAHHVIASSGGLITESTAVTEADLEALRANLESLGLGELTGLFFEMFVIEISLALISICVFVVIYGRMIEIYLMTSLAPIPFATFGNHEQSQIGQNYLRSLFALGFQGFLIMVCVGIYAVLIHGITVTDNIHASLWGILGYTVLLCFTLFKTGSLAKGIFSAH
ncbi:MAG: hypothetical protein J5825_06590 [Lachnospiraceae bacterium]|nr:hypothetical protein [Lachnospiraceae bacterium]